MGKYVMGIQKPRVHLKKLTTKIYTYCFLQNIYHVVAIPKSFNGTFVTTTNQTDLYISLVKKKVKKKN